MHPTQTTGALGLVARVQKIALPAWAELAAEIERFCSGEVQESRIAAAAAHAIRAEAKFAEMCRPPPRCAAVLLLKAVPLNTKDGEVTEAPPPRKAALLSFIEPL